MGLLPKFWRRDAKKVIDSLEVLELRARNDFLRNRQRRYLKKNLLLMQQNSSLQDQIENLRQQNTDQGALLKQIMFMADTDKVLECRTQDTTPTEPTSVDQTSSSFFIPIETTKPSESCQVPELLTLMTLPRTP